MAIMFLTTFLKFNLNHLVSDSEHMQNRAMTRGQRTAQKKKLSIKSGSFFWTKQLSVLHANRI